MQTQNLTKVGKLSLRVNEANNNHHLWNNRGVWWCHLTIHQADTTVQRMRFSLKTKDIEKARERRDRIFRRIAEESTHTAA
jgi:hypothetical protein